MFVFGLLAITLLGVCVGITSGLLGIGGNIIAIPVLLFIFKSILHLPASIAMHLVLGTSFVVMVFTALSSTTSHYKQKHIAWNVYNALAPFMIIGVIAGAICASLVNGYILEKIFGVFLFLIAVQMWLAKENKDSTGQIKTIPFAIYVLIGGVIGFKSGLLGIGGGAILIPFLLYLNYPAKIVVGTTAVCSLTVATVGAITFFITGSEHNLHIPYTLGFIYLPALIIMAPLTFIGAKIGAKLSARVPQLYMKRMLNLLLAILSIMMIV